MSLFNFRLKHPDNVTLWGKEGNHSIHWFGLTDGEYWIDTGDSKLYEYTEDIQREWKTTNPFIDYQVSRFVEDLYNILPSVHVPVSDALFEHVNTHEKMIHFQERYQAWVDRQDDDDTRVDEFIKNSNSVMSWVSERHIDSMHMINGPHVWLFRNRDRIRIVWHAEGVSEKGNPYWTAKSGQTEMNYSDFIDQVKLFAKQFFDSMEKQVEFSVQKDWGHVQLDKNRLQSEQNERRSECEETIRILKEPPAPFDWSFAEHAIRELL